MPSVSVLPSALLLQAPFTPQNAPSLCTDSGTLFASRHAPPSCADSSVQLAHPAAPVQAFRQAAGFPDKPVRFASREGPEAAREQSLTEAKGMERYRLALSGVAPELDRARVKATAGAAEAVGSPGTNLEKAKADTPLLPAPNSPSSIPRRARGYRAE